MGQWLSRTRAQRISRLSLPSATHGSLLPQCREGIVDSPILYYPRDPHRILNWMFSPPAIYSILDRRQVIDPWVSKHILGCAFIAAYSIFQVKPCCAAWKIRFILWHAKGRQLKTPFRFEADFVESERSALSAL